MDWHMSQLTSGTAKCKTRTRRKEPPDIINGLGSLFNFDVELYS